MISEWVIRTVHAALRESFQNRAKVLMLLRLILHPLYFRSSSLPSEFARPLFFKFSDYGVRSFPSPDPAALRS